MVTSKVVLIFTPPGKRDLFAPLLRTLSDEIIVHDIETRLKTRLEAENLKVVIEQNSRESIRSEWETTIDGIIDNIISERETSSKVNVLVGHSLYFKNSTGEIFPVFNSSYLKMKAENKIEITHVILVIDDVFDTYIDLSRDRELYSTKSCYDFLRKYARSRHVELESLAGDPKPYTSWIYHCINQLLDWRSQEIILAQGIANQLKSKFMIWGLKQDPKALVSWFIDKERKIFYISHPISQPRRNEINNGEWPSLVNEINRFQVEAKDHNLYTVIPTAIDEYRFAKDDDNNYTSLLDTRWPVPASIETLLTDSHLIGNYQQTEVLLPYNFRYAESYDIEKTDRVNVTDLQEFLNGSLTSLEMSIVRQLSNRDHLLVWLTDGIIVIDPYSIEDNRLHGGVGMELRNLQGVNQSLRRSGEGEPSLKKLCAIFPKKVIEQILSSEDFKNRTINKIRENINVDYTSIGKAIVDSMVNENGKLISNISELGSTVSPSDQEKIIANFENYQKQAILEQFLSTALLMDSADADYTIVLIVNEINNEWLSQENIQKINNFLIDETDDQWQDEIIEIARTLHVIIESENR